MPPSVIEVYFLYLKKGGVGMRDSTKVRVQISFKPEQLVRLRALADRREVSIAELVRQGVDLLLEDLPVEDDPLLDIIGLVDEGPEDLSERHDAYLAETITQDNR
jgi:hypothetical protein